jgi:hypothetical protein
MAAIRNEGFLNFFFVTEQFLRFFSKREPPILWSVPLLTFWSLVLVWFFPWTAFLPAGLLNRKSQNSRERTLIKLGLSWAVVILGFFSVTDRLEHYAFPMLPALPLLISGALSRTEENRSVKWGFRGLAILGILILAAGICGGIWLAKGPGLDYVNVGPQDRLSEADFTILADMPASVLRNLLKPAAVTVLVIAAGFLIALWFENRRKRIHAVLCIAISMAAICGMVHWSLSICEDFISSKKFALKVAQEAKPGDHLVIVGDYESANSLNFYQPLDVEVYDGLAYALVPGLKLPGAPSVILTKEKFSSLWQSDARVYALIPKDRMAELSPPGMEMQQILHRMLLRNH